MGIGGKAKRRYLWYLIILRSFSIAGISSKAIINAHSITNNKAFNIILHTIVGKILLFVL